MSQGDQLRFNGISPIVPVADITAALGFYRDSLGFELGWKSGEPATHANVCRDDIDITLVHDPAAIGSGNAYVYVTGVDSYHAQLAARGVKVGDVLDRGYGMRDFEIRDPYGNRLIFGQPASVS